MHHLSWRLRGHTECYTFLEFKDTKRTLILLRWTKIFQMIRAWNVYNAVCIYTTFFSDTRIVILRLGPTSCWASTSAIAKIERLNGAGHASEVLKTASRSPKIFWCRILTKRNWNINMTHVYNTIWTSSDN